MTRIAATDADSYSLSIGNLQFPLFHESIDLTRNFTKLNNGQLIWSLLILFFYTRIIPIIIQQFFQAIPDPKKLFLL